MLSVKGIYENGQITLLESIPDTNKAEVIVTVLDSDISKNTSTAAVDDALFDDLVGAISLREDGSIKHDQYLSE